MYAMAFKYDHHLPCEHSAEPIPRGGPSPPCEHSAQPIPCGGPDESIKVALPISLYLSLPFSLSLVV